MKSTNKDGIKNTKTTSKTKRQSRTRKLNEIEKIREQKRINRQSELSKFSERKRLEKSSKKRIINVKAVSLLLLVLGVIIFAFILFLSRKPVDSDGFAHNKNKTFIKQQKIDGVVFKDIDCIYDGKNSLITYKISNATKKKIYLKNYDVLVKDKDGRAITKIVVNSSQYIDPNKDVEMANSVVGVDLTNAYYMDLKLKTGDN